ncbi:efflux transporter outer membrane subunit [Pseudobacter ginsenosidimutans]|uniref:NodT family efflux transporter outer membrane factor (OMF) lipoprotein n=1 Tax=Pseudobacter ginsenosidimutans TaxID=661488 RepID=A0A4Q7N2X1_9BACT|nr:efflux transporter outer membrane subunit [Pseudobacter ginsenosidimutans]QEC43965.1 efflux transporter outer membrane subunit [Pseudobacter ginsenosidimutans]RZS75399.1 NodT family efflux transporter outer membrane factor (OMF) lipoprotein [Pseudobacter ginsenosidimutans]
MTTINTKLYKSIAVALAFAGFLSACKVGKNYQRPELPLPQQFIAADSANAVSYADTSSIADIQWKEFFTDPALQGLISKGITYNNNLQAAIKRMDQAQQQVRQAKLLQLPDVNLQIQGSINRPSDNSLNGLSVGTFLGKSYVENYVTSLNFSWEADIWGKIRRQQEVTIASYLQQQEAVKAVQTQLISDIAQGYYNLLMLDKQLEITKNNLLLNDSLVLATRALRDGGSVTTLAVQQVESQRQATALLIPQLEESIVLQENALQLLTGQNPGTIEGRSTLSQQTLREQLSAGLPIAMVSRRPDVRSSEMALTVANARVGLQQANMYPALNITAGGGLESFKASNWWSVPNSLFGLATGTLLQPIFNRRNLKTNYEVAKSQRDEAVANFRQSVLQATSEVSNALTRTVKLKEQRVIADAQVDTLRSAVQNAQLLFKSDMANYLEVITAQTNALQAELNVATIQRSQLGVVVELYRSLGGGYK